MTRVTAALRGQMVSNALKLAGITAGRKDLCEKRAALADAIRIDALDGPAAVLAIENAESDALEIIKGSAFAGVSIDSWCGVYGGYRLDNINLGGMSVTLRFNGAYSYEDGIGMINLYKKPIPESGSFSYKANSKFTIEYLKLDRMHKDVENKASNVKAQTQAAISQFTTVKKLLEAWPEAKALLPIAAAPAARLPVVLTKNLNKMIGLPAGVKQS